MSGKHESEVYANPLWSRSAKTAAITIEDKRGRVPYQATLRSIGSFIDDRHATGINILETPDGFSLRYESPENPCSPEVTLLRFSELLSLPRELENKRHRGFSFGPRRSEGVYEDRLRALGFELDGVQAYSVLIDELEDSLIVTFQYLEPSEGFNAHKRMVLFGPDEMQSVLDDAHHRRDPIKRGLLKMRAG
ncbi:MAG: hypothetical protein NVSMB52_01660 [Chloroflexota bacterium]